MIGGVETRIPVPDSDATIEVAVRAIRDRWQSAAFENGTTGERYPTYRDIPFGELTEVFVYKDAKTADRWDQEGAVPDLMNTMIHVLKDGDLLVLVVDNTNVDMQRMLRTVVSALRSEIFNSMAVLELAQ